MSTDETFFRVVVLLLAAGGMFFTGVMVYAAVRFVLWCAFRAKSQSQAREGQD